jgi:hypothetical protein
MRRHLILAATVLVLAAGCSAGAEARQRPSAKDPPPPAAKCERDADCVPAGCCHPDACVLKSAAPDCSQVACTMECRPGTLDCGNGRCACEAGSCTAKLEQR